LQSIFESITALGLGYELGLDCIEVPEARGCTRTQVSIEEVSKSERKIGL